jgi:carbamoyl-phosphate synthase large subunit
MAAADKAIVVPGVYERGYVDAILNICKGESVDAVISLNDLELPILAEAEERFDEIGVKLIVSATTVIDICFDKWETIRFARTYGLDVPATFISGDEVLAAIQSGVLSFPLCVKPRWGSASIGIDYPESVRELEISLELLSLKISRSILSEVSRKDRDHSILIQKKLEGTEYGVDVLNDFDREPVQVFVKEKLAMRAGETDKAVLRKKPTLEQIGMTIGKNLGHIGNLDCDFVESNGTYYLLEMNPRFGGGYPFTHMAGGNYPAAIMAMLRGERAIVNAEQRVYDKPFAKCDMLIPVSMNDQ